ncbi:unnamed protein product [Ectocarpus fasciculatus]
MLLVVQSLTLLSVFGESSRRPPKPAPALQSCRRGDLGVLEQPSRGVVMLLLLLRLLVPKNQELSPATFRLRQVPMKVSDDGGDGGDEQYFGKFLLLIPVPLSRLKWRHAFRDHTFLPPHSHVPDLRASLCGPLRWGHGRPGNAHTAQTIPIHLPPPLSKIEYLDVFALRRLV